MPDSNDEQTALDQNAAKMQALMALQKAKGTYPANPATATVNQMFNPVPSNQNNPSPDLSGQGQMSPQQLQQFQAAQAQNAMQAPQGDPSLAANSPQPGQGQPAQVQMKDVIANALKVKQASEDEQLKGLFPSSGQ